MSLNQNSAGYRTFLFTLALLWALAPFASAEEGDAIEIAKVTQDEPVSFTKQILPVLRKKCLACHNSTEAESDLVLETPEAMIKGGSLGEGIIPGSADDSYILSVAAHIDEPYMPPADNDVEAENMTPQELGLLKLWIDQGAKSDLGVAGPIKWQPLPPGVNPIYAAAVSADGQYAAAGRANQIFIYHVPSKREIGRLTDPELAKQLAAGPGTAHLDLVQSIAFAPTGKLIASGGYRTAKLWRRPSNVKLHELTGIGAAAKALAVSDDKKWIAIGEESGAVQLYQAGSPAPAKTLKGHGAAVTGLDFSADNAKLVSTSLDKTSRVWTIADGKETTKIDLPAEGHSVAWLNDKEAAAGCGDNVIRVLSIEEAKSVRDLAGHSQPAVSLVAFGDQQLLSGSGDGTVRHWNGVDGKLVRQMAHGGPVTSVAVSSDATKFASAGSNSAAKIWNAENGSQLFELKGDFRVSIDEAAQAREASLAKRRVDLANADLKKAQDRKKAEEENKKKADEALKAAEEDLAKKVEAAKKPVADKAAADTKLTEATAAVEKAEADKKSKDEAAAKLAESLKAEQAKQTEANTAAAKAAEAETKAKAAVASATEAANKAKQAVDAAAKAAEEAKANAAKAEEAAKTAAKAAEDAAKAAADKPDDKALADAAAAAKTASEQASEAAKAAADKQAAAAKALADAEAGQKTADAALAKAKTDEANAVAAKKKADEAKATVDKAVADLQAKATKATEEQKVAAAALTKAQAAVKTAEAAVKKLEGPAKKAMDEQAAAERTLAAAKRSVDRAVQSVKKSTDAIPPIEETIKTLTEKQKQEDEKLAEAKKVTAESAKPIHAVAFSADGATLATAGEDQIVHLWDVATGAPLDNLQGQDQPLTQLAYLGDGHLLSVGGASAVQWDSRPDWRLERVIGNVDDPTALVDRVTAVAFSHDGKWLATGSGEPSRSGEVKIWNVEDGSLVRALKEPHSDTVFGLEFSREDQFLATCGADRFVKVFDAQTGEFVRSFEGHTHHVLGVTWSADSRTLASSGADKVIKIWDVRTGDQKRTISGFAKEVTSIQFVSDSVNVVVSCGDSNVFIRRTDNGGNVRTLGGAQDFVYAADATADGKVYVAGGEDSVFRIWADNGQVIVAFEPPQDEQAESETGSGS